MQYWDFLRGPAFVSSIICVSVQLRSERCSVFAGI